MEVPGERVGESQPDDFEGGALRKDQIAEAKLEGGGDMGGAGE